MVKNKNESVLLEPLKLKIINNKQFIDLLNNYNCENLNDFYSKVIKKIFDIGNQILDEAKKEYNQKFEDFLKTYVSDKILISKKELKIKTNELIKILNLDINLLINDINNIVLKIQNFYANNQINYLQRIKIENEK